MDIKKIPEIMKLSIPEKILLVEDIWDLIASQGNQIPVPDSHKKELDSRHKKYMKNPGKLLTLKELQQNIEKRK